MNHSFFCPRCGFDGLLPREGRAACDRCGHVFAVPVLPGQAAGPTAIGIPRTVGYDVATATLLYLFAPVGLALLWSHPTWPHRRKVLLSCVVVGGWGLLLLLGFGMTAVYMATR